MAEVYFFLPELSIDKKITPPARSGLWKNDAKTVIRGISDAIVVGENAQGVSSIPDIWARPLMFQNFLSSVYKKRNPKSQSKQSLTFLEERAFQEWKGLLSILALSGTKLRFDKIEIEPFYPTNQDRFGRAISNLSPRPVFLDKKSEYLWTDILIIRYNDVPVGAFSPSTLVYTAADYNRDFKKKFEAQAGKSSIVLDAEGYLCPPTRESDLWAIGEWVSNVKRKLDQQLNTRDETRETDRLIATMNSVLFEIWLEEIREKLNIPEGDIDSKEVKISGEIPYFEENKAPAFIDKYDIYQTLLHPLVGDTSGISTDKSDIELSVERKELEYNGKKVEHVLIISEKLYSEDYRIWDQLRYTALGSNATNIITNYFNQPSGQEIKGKDIPLANEGVIWIRPELFLLTDNLLTAKNSGALLSTTESAYNINTKYIYPFRTELLNLYSPGEVMKTLQPSFDDKGDRVVFSFSLPLIGGEKLTVKKVYKRKNAEAGEGLIIENEVPIVEIFPNYLGDNWRRYYLFQGDAGKFLVNPIVQADCDIQTSEFDFKDSDAVQKLRVSQLTGDNSFPEALEVTNEKKFPLGLIFVGKTGLTQGLKHKWTVGIDFGTSNTNVYRNRGSADSAERWTYDFPSYYRSITLSDPDLRKKVLEEYFLPTRKVNLPIPTTLKIYNLAKKNSMVLDYFIYYPVEYRFPENVLSDIKWDGEGERKTEYFLESLLFLLLIEVVKEGVSEVQLACSYPKAFSQTNISVFQREWGSVFDKLLKPEEGNSKTRILNIHRDRTEDNEIKTKIKKPVFKTEGISAGEYFASERTIPKIEERANKEIAAICMDVGGGTTDISIWYLNNIEFDSSVLLAGRQISNLLQKNNRVRELLFSKDAAIALEDKKNEPVFFSARLNLILKNEEEKIQEMLVKHANNKDIQWLRQIIALEFGALAFYAAEVCVSTNEKVGGLLTRIADDGIHLHWGGNAAKLINWIDFGKYSKEGIASNILNATFFNCLNDKTLAQRAIKAKALGQLQSPGHKSEASGGLVVMDLDRSNGTTTVLPADFHGEFEMPDEGEESHTLYIGTICGENIELTDGKLAFYEPIIQKDLFDENGRSKFKASTLERIIRFVDILNFFGIKNGLFTEDTKIILGETEKRIIKDGVMKDFIKMQSLPESQRLIEPVFIMEVKLLLEILKSKMN